MTVANRAQCIECSYNIAEGSKLVRITNYQFNQYLSSFHELKFLFWATRYVLNNLSHCQSKIVYLSLPLYIICGMSRCISLYQFWFCHISCLFSMHMNVRTSMLIITIVSSDVCRATYASIFEQNHFTGTVRY